MGILSIQSQVAAGYVGNSAAIFGLQRLGAEVWPLPTVLLSHHPGHGGSQGGPVPLALMQAMLDGLSARGCFKRCPAVLSGYLGQAGAADIVRQAVACAKAGTPNAVYLCDPVLGDDGRLYVSDAIAAEMQGLVAMADIVTPNAFELERLSGVAFNNRGDAVQAMRALQAKGPRLVVLTSFTGTDTPKAMLDVMVLDRDSAWQVSLPDLRQKFFGAGDLFAGVFLDAFLNRREAGAALAKACSVLQAVLEPTAAALADELLLIESQDLLVAPRIVFAAERIF
jgi:pyridoxine kinase